MSAALTAVPASVGAGEVAVAVARYSTVHTVPTIAQRDPLADLVRTTFPSSVTRVGEAVEMLLVPSGYRLSASSGIGPERAEFLDLPLPDVHRALGPLPLRLALETLAGPAFIVVDDPVHRRVSFERCAPAPGAR